ncbi:MAG: nickel pincer cofactor biosynthesis protein LarB [Candidatus Omnitrophica bacterium]|nr:nickel pincer cofactor biosynthesis protein LarB [Candidatus Omnitrophota bacterium]
MRKTALKGVLKKLRSGKISLQKAFCLLKDLPYTDLGFAKLDNHRAIRRGFPEAVYCERKTPQQIEKILRHLIPRKEPLLLTRASEECFERLRGIYPELKFNKQAGVIYANEKPVRKKQGYVLIVTAGTSDIPVAEEARVTLETMGSRVKTLYDAGVAGIHRVLDKRGLLEGAAAIIVVAGMEGALASVISGLVSKPVIAVPTSVGYGASFKGLSALLTMLNCCSPGVSVVNIDNGFGAGYFAGLISKS